MKHDGNGLQRDMMGSAAVSVADSARRHSRGEGGRGEAIGGPGMGAGSWATAESLHRRVGAYAESGQVKGGEAAANARARVGEDVTSTKQIRGLGTLVGLEAIRDKLELDVSGIAVGEAGVATLGEERVDAAGGEPADVGEEGWMWGDESADGWRSAATHAADDALRGNGVHMPGGTWDGRQWSEKGLQATGADVALPAHVDKDGSVVYEARGEDVSQSAYVVNQVAGHWREKETNEKTREDKGKETRGSTQGRTNESQSV